MATVENVFSLTELKEFQRAALDQLLKGTDVFLSVKTGAGKSICYQAFHPMWMKENPDSQCTVLVICPLISIMKEQTDYLIGLGFSATYIGKDTKEGDGIKRGEYSFIFSSPEAVVGNPEWRTMLLGPAGEYVRLLVIDEAHTVLHWGESDGCEEPFRQWYGKLGELRSLLECPVLLLTATANKSARKKLQQKFGMKNCHEIIDNPERENIKLFVKKVKSSIPLDELFYFVIKLLREKKELCQRFIIFCTSINACGQIVSLLRLHLHEDIKFVQMYHSKTPESIKEEIKSNLDNPDGNIRVLVATSAAGMGVNFKGVYNVINYGPPKDMDTFVQEFGRAGRDGKTSMALLLFNGKQCKNLDSDMKNYISNTDQCRRECLLNAYNCKPSPCVKHLCCDICDKSCDCENNCSDYQHPFLEFVLSDVSTSDSDDSDGLYFEDLAI